METLATYIPIDRRQALAAGCSLVERMDGAAVFADISGFTALTEMLVQRLGNKRGAEELTQYLNQVYEALIGDLHRYGGSVITFSGDAVTCWLDGDDGRRAVAVALAMQQTMTQFADLEVVPGEQASLQLKTAVVAGPARRFPVGDSQYMVMDVMTGNTLERLAAAEHLAGKGDVILDEATAVALADLIQVTEWREDDNDCFAVITSLNETIPETPWSSQAVGTLGRERARDWLLPAVYQRLEGAQQAFLAELRPATTLFLRFGGIDYDYDPDAPRKLDSFIRQVEHILQKVDGSLLQLTIGDKGAYLYAVFGAPFAHEDDVARAAAAALELQTCPQQFPFLEPIQIGITHGRVYVGAYGSSTRRTFGVLGDTVNLAARLMQAAVPGQILANEDVYSRAQNNFTWETLAAIRVKGKSEPVTLFHLTGFKTETAVRTFVAQFPQPLVGRQTAVTQLTKNLTQLTAGKGQIVRLVGEAGMGKSHVAAHFSQLAQAEGVHLVLGACQSLSQNTLYYPWRHIFNSLLGLQGLIETEAVAQLTSFLKSEHPDWVLRLPLLGDLLELPIPDNPTTAALESNIRQQSLFSLLLEMVRVWAEVRPLLIILENGHWLDEASLAFIKALGQQGIGSAPVLLLLIHRPELLGSKPLLPELAELSVYSELQLTEMPDDEIGQLALQQLDGRAASLLLGVVQHLARGNPFFVNELVMAMREVGQIRRQNDGSWQVSDDLLAVLQRANFVTQTGGRWQLNSEADLSSVKLGLPDSIHGLVLSRLDRLPETHKLTLKVSSVVGYYIDLVLVTEVHPEDKKLADVRLEAEELEAEQVVLEEMSEQEIYVFRHHTIQEVAYDTLLFTQRRQLHRAVAETLAEQQPDAVTQIAHHAFLGELWPLSLQYNLRAGEQAKLLYANQQSIDYLQKGLHSAQALLESETAESLKRIHLALGELLVNMGQYDTAHKHLQAAQALAAAAVDWQSEARCYRWYGRSHERRGEYALAMGWLDKGFAALNGEAALEEAEISLIAGLINIRQGSYEEALQYCRRSLQVGRTLQDTAVLARTYNLMGIVDRRRGDSGAAVERFTQSLAQYETLQNVYGQATSHNLIANGYFMRGEWTQADFHYRQSLDLFTQLGSGYSQVLVNNNLGGIAMKQGRLDAALGYYQRAVRLLEQTGGSLWVFGALYMNMGQTYIRRRELHKANARLEMAQAYFAQAQQRDLLPELYGLMAEKAWRQGNLQTAERQAQRAIDLAQEMSMPREEGRTRRILGEIAHGRQQEAEARAQFLQSGKILHEAGDEYELARTQLSLANLYAVEGKLSQAREMLTKCEAVFGRLEAQLDLEEAQDLQQVLGGGTGNHIPSLPQEVR
ncbi:MAG: tetratricopeptide repeat protein [Chloroflexi bacterium]|nr:tetratricopeptide repeat protein [Chloroflexota bacterium]